MKIGLYIPFIVLMAVTYTRLAHNFEAENYSQASSRGPASVEVQVEIEEDSKCLNLPNKFNSHFHSENCL